MKHKVESYENMLFIRGGRGKF